MKYRSRLIYICVLWVNGAFAVSQNLLCKPDIGFMGRVASPFQSAYHNGIFLDYVKACVVFLWIIFLEIGRMITFGICDFYDYWWTGFIKDESSVPEKQEELLPHKLMIDKAPEQLKLIIQSVQMDKVEDKPIDIKAKILICLCRIIFDFRCDQTISFEDYIRPKLEEVNQGVMRTALRHYLRDFKLKYSLSDDMANDPLVNSIRIGIAVLGRQNSMVVKILEGGNIDDLYKELLMAVMIEAQQLSQKPIFGDCLARLPGDVKQCRNPLDTNHIIQL